MPAPLKAPAVFSPCAVKMNRSKLLVSQKTASPIIFIRHGETDWNREKRFQGQTDVPLNSNGKNQALDNARQLALFVDQAGLAGEQLRFVSSPLCRTTETTEIILHELGLPPQRYSRDDALTEVSFGLWEGLTPAEAKQRYYEQRQKRRKDRWSIAPPGGESFASRLNGVGEFLSRLPANSVVISHSGIMRIAFYLLQNLTETDAVRVEIPHIGCHIWQENALLQITNHPNPPQAE